MTLQWGENLQAKTGTECFDKGRKFNETLFSRMIINN